MTALANPCIVGIDPGLHGAVAWYFPSHPHLIRADDMPVVAGEVDAATFAAWVRQMRPTLGVIERVWTRPGEGASRSFKFGTGYGTIQGVLAACEVPYRLVTPQTWKKHHRLPADKEQARALALRLWPSSDLFSRKKDDGRAEAALIARYGAEAIPS